MIDFDTPITLNFELYQQLYGNKSIGITPHTMTSELPVLYTINEHEQVGGFISGFVTLLWTGDNGAFIVMEDGTTIRLNSPRLN
jgi:hypothetical protein